MKVSQLKLNKKNPRKISSQQMEKLKASIEKFPKMMSLRPIVYDPDTMEVLGGNQRLLAIRDLGMKEIPEDWVKSADELTEKEKREFIIRDNIQAGDWDFEILEAEFSDFEYIKVGATLTCLNDSDSKRYEPGAPVGSERIEALKIFSENGIKTWVSFEPVLFPDQTLKMIEMISGFIDHIKIGKLNNHPWEKEIDWKTFLVDAVKLCRELGLKFYVKNDLAKFGDESMFRFPEREMDYFNV